MSKKKKQIKFSAKTTNKKNGTSSSIEFSMKNYQGIVIICLGVIMFFALFLI